MDALSRVIVRDGLILIGVAFGLCLLAGMVLCWSGS
jgi:hypothetical protein